MTGKVGAVRATELRPPQPPCFAPGLLIPRRGVHCVAEFGGRANASLFPTLRRSLLPGPGADRRPGSSGAAEPSAAPESASRPRPWRSAGSGHLKCLQPSGAGVTERIALFQTHSARGRRSLVQGRFSFLGLRGRRWRPRPLPLGRREGGFPRKGVFPCLKPRPPCGPRAAEKGSPTRCFFSRGSDPPVALPAPNSRALPSLAVDCARIKN